MPKGIKYCKVCGSAYEYCKTMRSNPDMFRWQDVACCPEHGAQYLALVLKARGQKQDQQTAQDAVKGADETAAKKKSRKKKTEPEVPADAEEMA